MGRIINLLLIILLACGSLFAQQRNTVYTILASNVTTQPASPYLVSNNIGQTYHSFVVTLANGTNCSTQNFVYKFSATVEASFDGNVYTAVPQLRISIVNDSTNNASTKLYRAAGAFPFIRFRVTHYPTTITGSCSSTIAYTGSLSSTPLSDVSIPNTFTLVGTAGNTTTCTSVVQYTSEVGSSAKLAIVSLNIQDLSTTNAVGVLFYSDSACTNNIFGITVFPNLTVTLPVDPLNSPIFSDMPDTSGYLGWYLKTNVTQTAYVTLVTTLLN